MPLGFTEAHIIVETGLPPQVLAEMDARQVDMLMLYKEIRMIAEFGGDWSP